jgi:putative acetyltransferase
MDIRLDDLSSEPSRALLRLHLEGMHASSPPGHVFALDYSGLKAPNVTVWSIWEGDAILGIGALRQIDAQSAEVKSMRTHPNHVRRGAARALLEHIIAEARRRGVRRLSLETGSGPASTLRSRFIAAAVSSTVDHLLSIPRASSVSSCTSI